MLFNHFFSKMVFSIAFIPQSVPFSSRDTGNLRGYVQICGSLQVKMWFSINWSICSLDSNPFRKMVKEASSLETLTVADTCFLNDSRQAEIAVWSLSVTESVSLNLSLSPTNSQETVPLYDFLNVLTQFFFFFLLIISSSHRLPHYFYFLRIKVTVHCNGSMKIDTKNYNSLDRDKGQTYEPEGKWNQRNNLNDSYAYTVCQSLQSTFTYMIYNNLQ